MNKKLNPIINPMLIILFAVVMRLFPHQPNFTPIAAMALFSGVYLTKKWALVLPLLVMIISDYLILYINPFSASPINFSQLYNPLSMFHSTTVFVYISFIISGLLGMWLKTRKSVLGILKTSILASLQFFVITNLGVWLTGYYPKTWEGLIWCYTMAIPFFKGTLLGDLFYTGLLFGGYELVLRLIKKINPSFAR